jgi:cytochrome c-type biogenesis protein CcmH/NrfG
MKTATAILVVLALIVVAFAATGVFVLVQMGRMARRRAAQQKGENMEGPGALSRFATPNAPTAFPYMPW